MRKSSLVLLSTMFLIRSVNAQDAAPTQDVYLGLGFPGGVVLGYGKPMGETWGLRWEYGSGLKRTEVGTSEGVSYTGSVKTALFGAFADWYPFENGFRLVGGLTANNIKASLIGNGAVPVTINGKRVNLANETFDVDLKFPSLSPYLGLGYGHHRSNQPGLGFYADLGVMFGKFSSAVTTSLVGQQSITQGVITQSDVDTQTQKIRDSIANTNLLPYVAGGVSYRY
jgi:hypothetical protein